ncbi:MAG: nucleotidyltransferase family protein [Rhodomicrobium sp.]
MVLPSPGLTQVSNPLAAMALASYIGSMDRNAIIATLRGREAELRALGVVSLSLFGSAARGDATEESDIDVAVTLDPAATPRGFYYIGRLDELRDLLEAVLGRPVDLVPEPVEKPRFQQEIDRDRVRAF